MEYNVYNEKDNSELRRLQLSVLEIIKIFVDICNKYKLRYFIVGGTMLGAVRHQGFIPWDDDVDIGMPRPDYEYFLQAAGENLTAGYALLNYKTVAEYKRYFSRIVNTNIKVYNSSNSKEIIENAWIDIFPYDGMPRGRVKQKIHFWHMTSWRLLYHMSCFDELVNLNRPGRPFYQQLMIRFLVHVRLGRNLDSKKLLERIEKGLCRYGYDDSDKVVSLFGAYMEKEIISKQLLGELKRYPFENIYLPGPEQGDMFLTHFYGDWKTPPSDEQKDKHSIRRIEYTASEEMQI